MKEPSKTLLTLHRLGVITTIKVDYLQTGTDAAETFVRITGSGGYVTGKWATYEQYLDVSVDFRSIARLKDNYVKKANEWEEFLTENKNDIKEYDRLREKLKL